MAILSAPSRKAWSKKAANLISELQKICKEEKIDKIVLGLPRHMNYDIGDSVRASVQSAHAFLKNYDDVSAENLLRELLEELKNSARPVLGSTAQSAQSEARKPMAGGYYFK